MTDAAELVKRLRDPEFFSRTGTKEELQRAAREIETLRQALAPVGLSKAEDIATEIVLRAGDVYEDHEDDGAWAAMEQFYKTSIAAALAAQQDGAWMPIESAPKDGTEIDLWCGARITNAKWIDGGWCEYDSKWADWYNIEGGDTVVTHWMPLPAPPPL